MSGRNNESPSFFHALHTGVTWTHFRAALALVAVRGMRFTNARLRATAANYTQPMALSYWISHHQVITDNIAVAYMGLYIGLLNPP